MTHPCRVKSSRIVTVVVSTSEFCRHKSAAVIVVMQTLSADLQRTPRHLDRRHFLAKTVALLGLPHALRGASANLQIGYIGTYTETATEGVSGSRGLYSFCFNDEQGTINRIRLACTLDNPSYLATTRDRRRMIAVCEIGAKSSNPPGRVVSLALDPHGAATILGTIDGVGSMPCCVAITGNEQTAFCTSYEDGNLTAVRLLENGCLRMASPPFYPASGDEGPRSQLHHVCFSPKQTSLLIADFGRDRLLVYSLNDQGLSSEIPSQILNLGMKRGPRSIDHAPGTQDFYCLNQTSSTLMHLRWQNDNQISLLAEESCLPTGYTKVNFPSCIRVSPNGRHVFVSNRGHNSIAVFERTPHGGFGSRRFFASGGEFPRHFCFDRTGRWLLCGNQYSNHIAVYGIDPHSGDLSLNSRSPQIPAPAFIDL